MTQIIDQFLALVSFCNAWNHHKTWFSDFRGIEWEYWHEIEYLRMISWYRNQSINLLCKSDDLFLFQENINNKECLKVLRKYTNIPVFHDTLNSIIFAMLYIPIQLTKLVVTNFQSEINIIYCRNILQFRDVITLLSPAQ